MSTEKLERKYSAQINAGSTAAAAEQKSNCAGKEDTSDDDEAGYVKP